jgi:hypothetical protein
LPASFAVLAHYQPISPAGAIVAPELSGELRVFVEEIDP